MLDTYKGGYKKALLDVSELVEKQYDIVKSKKAYAAFLHNLFVYLLQNGLALDEFMDTQTVDVAVDKNGGVHERKTV